MKVAEAQVVCRVVITVFVAFALVIRLSNMQSLAILRQGPFSVVHPLIEDIAHELLGMAHVLVDGCSKTRVMTTCVVAS